MELYDLKLSEHTRFSVEVTDDYNVKGSFDPNAASDLEFFGYRETHWNIISAVGKDSLGWWPMLDAEVEIMVNRHEDKITLIVQDALDELEADNAV